MSKYKVVEENENEIKVRELSQVHKINTTHRILSENPNKYIVALANINGSEDYDIENNIIAEFSFSDIVNKLEGIENSDLLEIVLDRLKNTKNMNLYTAEAIHSVTNALVYLSTLKTDNLVEYSRKMYELQKKAAEEKASSEVEPEVEEDKTKEES